MLLRPIPSRTVELKGSVVEKDFNTINQFKKQLNVPEGSILSIYKDCHHAGKLVNVAFWDDYDLDIVYILE